ncbi:MAG: HD domain-containing protein [Thermoplasmata archaeon]|nr:MAG: HD domain-containing protein [Thermoplasmata archaeon]
MPDYKIIHDTVHGSIKLQGLFLDLLETPEIQRLHGINQLGLAYLVFPGANHTRLEHSIGTCFVASRIADSLGLLEDEKKLAMAAAMLHDIGHSPYSHTLEIAVHSDMQADHMDITKEIILGKRRILSDDEPDKNRDYIPDLLEKYDLDPEDVASLIFGYSANDGSTKIEDFPTHKNQKFFNEKRYISQMIHGAIDADQIDYLLRDSFYTGVAHGTIDIDRLIQTMEIFNNDLVVHKRGVPAVEGMLVARALMYTSVYFHKTVRIAELMLARAVELLDEPLGEIHEMNDSELMARLKEHGGFQKEIASMLKFRKLFKRAFTLTKGQASDTEMRVIKELKEPKQRRKKEEEICRRAQVPNGYVIIDVPEKELQISEPRIRATNVKILDNDKLAPLSRFSPLARALEVREVYDWEIMVSSSPRYVTKVEKVVKKVLFD